MLLGLAYVMSSSVLISRSILEDASKIHPEIDFDFKCRWWHKYPVSDHARSFWEVGNLGRNSVPSQDIVRQTSVQECKS